MDTPPGTVALRRLRSLLISRTVPKNSLLDRTLPKQQFIAQSGGETLT